MATWRHQLHARPEIAFREEHTSDLVAGLLAGFGMEVHRGLAGTGVVGTLGANYVWAIGHTDQTSADLELPLWIVYLCIPCGSYLMCFRFLQVAWAFFRTGELPKHDVSHVEGIEEAAAYVVPGLHPAEAGKGGAT